MLLFRALGCARNEGRQGKKMKKFWKKFFKILIANISASEPSIKNRKKVKISAPPSQFFFK